MLSGETSASGQPTSPDHVVCDATSVVSGEADTEDDSWVFAASVAELDAEPERGMCATAAASSAGDGPGPGVVSTQAATPAAEAAAVEAGVFSEASEGLSAPPLASKPSGKSRALYSNSRPPWVFYYSRAAAQTYPSSSPSSPLSPSDATEPWCTAWCYGHYLEAYR